MSYGVDYDESAATQLYSWGLSLGAYEEIERHIEVELSEHPTKYLRDVGGTMQYTCRFKFEGKPHVCLFRVRYSQDEQTLIIWDCHYFPFRL
jgi:hypothetical protein